MMTFLPQTTLPFIFFLLLLILIIWDSIRNAGNKAKPTQNKAAENKPVVTPTVQQEPLPVALKTAEKPLPTETKEEEKEEEAQPETILAEEKNPEPTLHDIAAQADDENLKGLILDRLEEVEELEDEPVQQALCLVNLLDELRTVRKAFSGNDTSCIKLMLNRIQKILHETGCELLDSDTWEPAIQRAIKIDYVLPEGQEPVITEKGASGLKVRGRLIRKQEVHIQKCKQA